MSLKIAVIAGMLHITAPASPEPVQYLATAFGLPGQQLQWRGRDYWVAPHLCYDRCGTIPGQDNVLLAGGLSERDAADIQLTVWRKNGDRWVPVMHCAQFFYAPHCGSWGR